MLDVRDKPAEDGGKIMKRILMANGNSFAVQGGSKKETLGEILLEQGKLSPEIYESLKQEAGGDYGKIEIGDGTAVEEGAILHAPPNDTNTIGNNVTIGHGAVVHGKRIGDGAVIGMGAIVSIWAEIGTWAIVAEASVVKLKQSIPS